MFEILQWRKHVLKKKIDFLIEFCLEKTKLDYSLTLGNFKLIGNLSEVRGKDFKKWT